MKAAQIVKKMIPGFVKKPATMRWIRVVTTPILGTWNSLVRTGQLRSCLMGKPLDEFGLPIPWFAYSAIRYLNEMNINGKELFEYGSGNSTLYWVRRGCKVSAVEAHEGWARYVQESVGSDAQIYFESTEKDYAKSIRRSGVLYDIIVVDGAYRHACAKEAVSCLKPGGFIVLDNAEAYTKVADFLRSMGLMQVDFVGSAPLVHTWQSTSLFIHPECDVLNKKSPAWIKGMVVFPKGWEEA